MKLFDACKTRMIVLLPYGEKNYDDVLSRFHTIPACYGQTVASPEFWLRGARPYFCGTV